MATQFRQREFQAPPPAAVSRILSTFDRKELEGFIAVALDLLDLADGDPDLEDGETGNCWVDERGRWCGPGPCPDGPWNEDDEEEQDMCLAGDDRVCSGSATGALLLCEDTGPGDADDTEPNFVPCEMAQG